MIPPREQWCIQIDVTNACPRTCSNCTRLLSHARERFWMTVPEFEAAIEAVADFSGESEPDAEGRTKVIGIIGGEPLLHAGFTRFSRIMQAGIASREHRGLWTGLHWQSHRSAKVIREVFGYINQNQHLARDSCFHQPVLVAIQDVIYDEELMWKLIDNCPLQRKWSSAITPKGFFFCEVAAAFDMVFEGPGGVPVTPGCWWHDLADYREQIERWCPRCGVCLPLAKYARRDSECVDDITKSNLEHLRALGSPAIAAGRYVEFDVAGYSLNENLQGWEPLRYLKEPKGDRR